MVGLVLGLVFYGHGLDMISKSDLISVLPDVIFLSLALVLHLEFGFTK